MPDAIVAGAGVIGLAAARELQSRGLDVEIWTSAPTAHTTSAVAAALWYPFLAEPRDRVLGWAAVTFRALRELANDPATGVSMVRAVEAFAREPDLWWLPATGGTARAVAPPSGFARALEFELPLCDTTRYLPWLVATFAARGGRIVARTLRSLDEALAQAPAVVNCTGLGARELCGDGSLRAVRGQVVRVAKVDLPHAFLDDTAERPLYVLPRRDDVVLGGTAQDGDERTRPDERDTETILASCRAAVPALRAAKVLGTAVGLRPCRPAVRLEREDRGDGRRVVHDYGHGGSGFTLAHGCAREAADLLLHGVARAGTS